MAMGARSQAAKTYLERKLDEFAGASQDALISHALLALQARTPAAPEYVPIALHVQASTISRDQGDVCVCRRRSRMERSQRQRSRSRLWARTSPLRCCRATCSRPSWRRWRRRRRRRRARVEARAAARGRVATRALRRWRRDVGVRPGRRCDGPWRRGWARGGVGWCRLQRCAACSTAGRRSRHAQPRVCRLDGCGSREAVSKVSRDVESGVVAFDSRSRGASCSRAVGSLGHPTCVSCEARSPSPCHVDLCVRAKRILLAPAWLNKPDSAIPCSVNFAGSVRAHLCMR